MAPIQLTDLRVWRVCDECPHVDGHLYDASESDLLSVLTDGALIAELVNRGVLHIEEGLTMDPVRGYDVRPNVPISRFASDWEPVGSVGTP